MASVKRYDWGKDSGGDDALLEFTDGNYVLASDYDRLVEVCREFLAIKTLATFEDRSLFWSTQEKMRTLIGEGGEEA